MPAQPGHGSPLNPAEILALPLDGLKTSFWRGSFHMVFVNSGGHHRVHLAREPSSASRRLLLFTGEKPHISRISRSMVGFTRVGMSLAACAERETAIR